MRSDICEKTGKKHSHNSKITTKTKRKKTLKKIPFLIMSRKIYITGEGDWNHQRMIKTDFLFISMLF